MDPKDVREWVEDPMDPRHNVRRWDPDTCYHAAYGWRASHGSLRWRCYEALCKAGRRGLTDYELAELVGRQQNSAGKRRGELCKMGLVRDSGMRRLGPTCSPCIVWVVVE